MNLSTRLAGDFSSAVRNRGRSYFWQGRVRIQTGSSAHAKARVRGSESYEVSLDWKNGVLSAWCDCVYFESEGPCKHLWATILAAESRGYLTQAASATRLVLDCGDHDPDDGFEGFEDEDQEGFPLRPRSPVVVPQPVPQLPAWKKRIAGITESRSRTARPVNAWPAKREIVYVVDVPASLTAGVLVLALASRDRKVDGNWTPSSLWL